jgi:hypothetical protein
MTRCPRSLRGRLPVQRAARLWQAVVTSVDPLLSRRAAFWNGLCGLPNWRGTRTWTLTVPPTHISRLMEAICVGIFSFR